MNTQEEKYLSKINNSVEPGRETLIQDASKPQYSSIDIRESNNLDKVRDILVGNQMREVERRIARIEERLVKESSNLRDETKKRLDSLEMYIKKEVESLIEQLKNQQIQHSEALKEINEEQKNVNKALEKKISQLDDQNNISQREIREQILNQSKSLQDDIQQKYEEILSLLQRESRELRYSKTDRSTLAALFNEIAIRLNPDQ
jgi:leucyl aminopeptidase (aminopeptidase T)